MRVLYYLLFKEFAQIFRDKTTIRVILFMPAFQLLILPLALTFEQRNISLGVVDNDRSTTSRRLIESLTSTKYFSLTDYSDTYKQAMDKMDDSKSDLILVIPQNFEKELILEQNPKVMLTVDALNGMKGSIIMSYFSQIIQDFNLQIMKEFSQESGGIEIKPYYLYNDRMSYQDFMVPGILVILMSLIGGMLSSVNIVKEKEIGTIEQINVTPVSKLAFILGKLIPYWIIGLVILTIGLMISHLMYDLLPIHNYLNIYIFSLCYMIAFSGFGIIISNYSDTQQQAILSIFFFVMIFILLSGLFTPISSMPMWAQNLTIINPFRYFVDAMRMLFLKDSGFMDILPNLKVIFIFAIVFNAWAVISYKKTS